MTLAQGPNTSTEEASYDPPACTGSCVFVCSDHIHGFVWMIKPPAICRLYLNVWRGAGTSRSAGPGRRSCDRLIGGSARLLAVIIVILL
ncbi:hypothetical protein GDO81_026971 [Engystomops pustulosus]|uniref:Uncharacterized protein n=1 Tax=Engystomops pustulosus TaxID=76066 RepID=A0AAV6ZP51_ENGPU|nr:hypothetical protein GDO81_026971 [Engystomops pustulosus]